MRRTPDLTGKVFGKLTVLSQSVVEHRGKLQTMCHCRCECGNEVDVPASNLQKKDGTAPVKPTRSCGCTKTVGDLTGKKFGRLTVVSRYGTNREGILWLTRCECGNEKIVSGSGLTSGYVQSCGCRLREIQSNISSYVSEAHAGRTAEVEKRRVEKRFGAPGSPERQENSRRLRDELIVSGVRAKSSNIDKLLGEEPVGSNPYRGVCWSKSKQRWMAYCRVNGRKWSAYFRTAEEAKKARDEKQKELIEEENLEAAIERRLKILSEEGEIK